MKILSVLFALMVVVVLSPFVLKAEETRPDIVVTEGDIKKMNVRTIVELLNRIPGVSASGRTVSLYGSRMVTVLLDERPLNDPLGPHGGMDINWNLVSLEEVERVEIYRTGGTAFGGTSGGAIIITSRKVTTSSGMIEASFGNLDTQNYTLNYMKNIKSLGIGLVSEWNKTDGYRVNDDRDKKKAGLKLSYKTLSLSTDYLKEDDGRPGMRAFPTPQARYRGDIWSSAIGLKIGRLRSDTYYNHFKKIETNPERGLYTEFKSWTAGENIRTVFSAGGLGSFDTGLNLETAHIEGNKVEPRHEEKCGLYLIKNIRWKESPFNVGFGARINLYSEFPAVISPEIKAGYDSNLLSIQATARATHNIPSFLQRYYETSYLMPNPDLEMEKGVNYSLALSHRHGDSYEAVFSLFYSDIKDRITYVRQDGGMGRHENLGEVIRKGVEASVKWQPFKSLEIKPSYTYLIAKDETTGYWLTASPRHRVKLNVVYKPIQRFSLALDGEYLSRQFTKADNKESIPSYFVVDLGADYSIKKVGLFFKVENIFDKDYLYGNSYPAPPRTCLVGANYRF